jgi:hypothetical protein
LRASSNHRTVLLSLAAKHALAWSVFAGTLA